MRYRIYFFRHGKTRANLEHRYLGNTEEELCETGRIELQEQAKNVPAVDWLYTSPMLRCIQTAQILFPQIPYEICERFREINFGRFELKNYEELRTDSAYQQWIDSNGTLPFPEGESREAFIERNKEGFDWMLQDVRQRMQAEKIPIREASIGVVAHGGTIMALASALAHEEYFTYQCKNGEGYLFLLEECDKKLVLLEKPVPIREVGKKKSHFF